MSPKDTTVIDHVVGTRIAALRKTRGLSQTALGEAVGVTFQQIQKYEMGANRVGAGRLQVIAKFLDVPVSMLFSDDEETDEQVGAFEVLAVPGATVLLKAFLEIEDLQLRSDVLALVRTAAKMRGEPGTKVARPPEPETKKPGAP